MAGLQPFEIADRPSNVETRSESHTLKGQNLAAAVHHCVGKVGQGGLHDTFRQGLQGGNRLVRPITGNLPGLRGDGVFAQAGHGFSQGRVGRQIAVHQFQQRNSRGITGCGIAAKQQHGQRGHTLAEVGTRGLAGLDLHSGDIDDVVGKLEGNADLFAVFNQHVLERLISTREDRTELA